MTVESLSAWPLPVETDLSPHRTLDRRLVHRRAVAEVFLTDAAALDAQRVVLAAQLPPWHAYFHDHTIGADAVDPMLILEVCRQATLASAHALGVPVDVVLIASTFALQIIDEQAWRAAGGAPELRLDSRFTWTRLRRGRPRAGDCEQFVFIEGRPAARHRITGQLLTVEELQLLRSVQRESPAPSTADATGGHLQGACTPATVGRRDPRNVVLTDLRQDSAGRSVATVAPCFSNRALFDHAYDHLTMQVLTEAARQLALASSTPSELTSTSVGVRVVGLDGEFSRFAELDSPVTVALERSGPAPRTGPVTVRIEQADELVGRVTVTLSGTSTDEGATA